jgi:membrane protein YqaA with SNARE-associated domain
MILFWTARQGERALTKRSAPDGKAAKFRAWFRRYGLITVFVPAMVPIPMPLKLFVISAGVTGTAPSTFLGVILFARIVRYAGEAWLGVTLGRESVSFLKVHAWQFGLGAVILFAALYLFVMARDKRNQSPQSLP